MAAGISVQREKQSVLSIRYREAQINKPSQHGSVNLRSTGINLKPAGEESENLREKNGEYRADRYGAVKVQSGVNGKLRIRVEGERSPATAESDAVDSDGRDA